MNTEIIDKWTLAHVGAGMAMGAFQLPPAHALGGIIAFEFIEQAYTNENFKNIVMDIITSYAGYTVGKKLFK